MSNAAQTYIGLAFLSGLLAAVASVVVLGHVRRYARRVQIPFAVFSLSAGVWATAYGFQLGSDTLAGKVFWNRFAWLGVATLATFWFVFALSYVGQEWLLSRRTLALLAVEPGVVVALVFTSGEHGLFFAGRRLVTLGGVDVLVRTFGPLYTAHLVYSALLWLGGLVLLVRMAARSRRLYRRQTAMLGFAALVPAAAGVAGTLDVGPVTAVDPTPLSFSVTTGVVLLAFYRFQLFDVTPVARDVVFSEMRDGIVVLDDQHRVVETNPPAGTTLAVESERAIGRHLDDVHPQSDRLRPLLDDDRERVELTVGDGEDRRYYEATTSPLEPSQRHDPGHLLILRDVTERRRTEAQFRALIENSRDIISILDAEGRRRYCSPSIRHILGYDPEALQGRDAFEIVHPEDRESLRAEFRRAIDADEPVRAEFRFRDTEGTWRRFEAVGINLLDDPAVRGVVINSREVTDRHQYEQRLRVLNRVLRHDVRNDMNVILGNADLLLEADGVTAEAKEHARTIRRTADSLVQLSERTRKIDYTIHHADNDGHPVEIAGHVRDRLDGVRQEYPAAIIHHNLPSEVWVAADDLVESAVSNVVDNAIEHNDRVLPQVSVTVSSEPLDGTEYTVLRVADNGPGIPHSERDALEQGTETPLSHTSGLGLWLVKWIVENSDGRLEFDDNDPRGAVVRLYLRPADPPDAASDPGSRP